MKRIVSVVFLILMACQQETPSTTTQATSTAPAPAQTPAATADPHSYSNPQEVRVEHLSLDLNVDFTKKQLAGTATWRLKRNGDAKTLILDARDLTINSVTLQPGNKPSQFKLGEAKGTFGAPLTIPLEADTNAVTINYATSPNAGALQWLEPAQTAGKMHPFLLSQSQAILARTWVPTQDTPQVRFTYDAKIRVPRELLALMGAENPQAKSPDGVYNFRMPQPVPSYLLVVAAGDLEFRPLGPNSGVYAEPPVAQKAADEFVDTPKMIQAAESLYGPYRWGRYDMLVLPPSFPFGGMENPRLTFLTPTIIAGDRSLVALIAHELAHSWSGNLVTNATWNDFWLNEGFTTYFEHRITEKLYGKEYAEMLWALGVTEVHDEIASLPPADQHLYVNLEGRDPDDAPTIVYEKGALLLRLIEETVGRDKWDAFLRSYFDSHAFQSMTTAKFREALRAAFPGVEEKVNIEAWINGPGLPANAPKPQSQAFAKVDSERQAFLGGSKTAAQLNTNGWASHQWVHFVKGLPDTGITDKLRALDAQFKLSETGNNEVLAAFLQKAVTNQYREAYPSIERLLTSMGRRKFLEPLYKKLMANPQDVAFAKQVYAKARPTYHPLAVGTIDKIVK
ncbi:MAG TPA: M1 family metallopeptidase [Thermoanaerobaculia bacterium]